MGGASRSLLLPTLARRSPRALKGSHSKLQRSVNLEGVKCFSLWFELAFSTLLMRLNIFL